MQNHVDAEGKVALDDVTLRANRHHGNTISCFHFASWGDFFTRYNILWHPPHSGIISDPQATTLILIPNPELWPFEPKINRLGHSAVDYYRAEFQVIPIRGFRFIVITYAPTCTPTNPHHDEVITASAPPYYVVGADKIHCWIHLAFVIMHPGTRT